MNPHLVLVRGSEPRGPRKRDAELAEQFNANAQFVDAGYVAFAGELVGVAIERAGHFRGVWTFDGVAYQWTPAGYAESAHSARTPDAAIAYTLQVLGCA